MGEEDIRPGKFFKRRKEMKLKLERLYLKPDYTIGKLYIDGKYFCDTLEDQVRDLAKERKIPGRTAIPAGVYEVIVNISPRFRRKLPRLLDVPGFDGILIHRVFWCVRSGSGARSSTRPGMKYSLPEYSKGHRKKGK